MTDILPTVRKDLKNLYKQIWKDCPQDSRSPSTTAAKLRSFYLRDEQASEFDKTPDFKAELEKLPPAVFSILDKFLPLLEYYLSKCAGRWVLEAFDRVAPSKATRSWLIFMANLAFFLRRNMIGKERGTLNVGKITSELSPKQDSIGDRVKHRSLLSYTLTIPPRSMYRHNRAVDLDFEYEPDLVPRAFKDMPDLSTLSGHRIGLIGAGGGSDCIQAAILGMLCKRVGKEVHFVASVRASKTTSEGPQGTMGEQRTVQNHGGTVSNGVYKITPESTGSGRFLENIPAGTMPMFLVTEKRPPSALAKQIQDIIATVSTQDPDKRGIDTLVIVDTGGDILEGPLMRPFGESPVTHEQHQDLRVLQALASESSPLRKEVPNLTMWAAIVAPGIDAPQNADEVLKDAEASLHSLAKSDRDFVLQTYAEWNFTGSADGLQAGRYGKTPFAWQAAIKAVGELEERKEKSKDWNGGTDEIPLDTAVMPLPVERVLDYDNPWDPFVPLQAAMAGIVFVEAEKLLERVAPILDYK